MGVVLTSYSSEDIANLVIDDVNNRRWSYKKNASPKKISYVCWYPYLETKKEVPLL